MTSATPPVPPSPSGPTPPTPPPPGAGPRPPRPPGADPAAGIAVEGTTEVLPAVVQKVGAFAAREIPGVVALGGGSGASRALGAVRQTVTGSDTTGVRVEMDGETARLGIDVEIEYGVGARELVRALRRHVPSAVEEIAGVVVTALDIKVTDVHLPGGDPADS